MQRGNAAKRKRRDQAMGEQFRLMRLRLRPDLADRQKFADTLRVSAETVRLWEKGNHITDAQKRAICKLLGCDPADFYLRPGELTKLERERSSMR